MNVTKINHVLVVTQGNHVDVARKKYTHLIKVGMSCVDATTCQ